VGQDAPVAPGDIELSLQLPAGRYRVQWVATDTGEVLSAEEVASDGELQLRSSVFAEDVALGLVVAD